MNIDQKQAFFNAAKFKKGELNQVFSKMDELVLDMVNLINDHSQFVTSQLMNYYIDIISGKGRFKLFYEKKTTNRSEAYKGNKHDGKFIPLQDKEFLLKNYSLLHSFYNKSSDIEKFKFSRLVLYSIVEEFLLITKDYITICDDIASRNYSKLRYKEEIEEKVQIRDNYLYGTVKRVHQIHNRFLKYRNKIVYRYLRFVYSLAISSRSEEQFYENFQVGTLGLIRAILMFNPKKGSFLNYIKFWIKQSIKDNIYRSFLISIPTCSWNYYNKLEKIRPQTKNLKQLSKKSGLSEKHINSVYSRILTTQMDSLDTMIYENEIEGNHNFAYAPNEVKENELFDVMNDLTKLERRLVGLLYGNYDLIDNNKITRDEIELERARQLA